MNKEEQEKVVKTLDSCVEKAKEIIEDPEEVKKVLAKTQTKIDNSPALIEEGGDKLASMLNLVRSCLIGEYTDASEDSIANIVGSFIYVTEEFDTVPDIIPVVGYEDDIKVLSCAAERASADLEAYDKWTEGKITV